MRSAYGRVSERTGGPERRKFELSTEPEGIGSNATHLSGAELCSDASAAPAERQRTRRVREQARERIMAETRGFEPLIPFRGYNDLANRRLQPLGHVSGSVRAPV